MTITREEKEKIIADHETKKRRELSDRMRKLGKVRSPAKRAAGIRNVKKALAVRWGKPYHDIKPMKGKK